MVFLRDYLIWVVLTFTILHRVNSVSANCRLSVVDDNKLYDYSLDSPMPLFPHGVRSEDGYSLSFYFCHCLILVNFYFGLFKFLIGTL